MIARERQAVSARGKARDSPATRRVSPETNRVVENIQGGIAMNRRRFMYSVAAGGAGAALAAVRDGVEAQKETGQLLWAAELHRLEGIALLGLKRLNEAQRALEEALRVARRQEARAYELRAAASLTRLWGEQGRRAEARELLAPVYAGFTEGFNTADLKNAKALLDALA